MYDARRAADEGLCAPSTRIGCEGDEGRVSHEQRPDHSTDATPLWIAESVRRAEKLRAEHTGEEEERR